MEDALTRWGRWTAALCFVPALAACSAQTSPVYLDVYTWWRETSEQRAIQTVVDRFEEKNEGVEVSLRGSRNATTSREELARLLLNEAPPATFQANVGADLLRWRVSDYHDAVTWDFGSKSLLQGLDDLFTAEGFYEESVLPAELLAALRPGNETAPYGVPINIHRLNVVYYNVERVTEKLGNAPLTLDAFCPAEGVSRPDFSIAVGIGNGFPLTLLIFENLIPALEGADFYEALFTGNPPTGWETRIRRALECVLSLSPSFEGGEELSWADAADRVATGDAALTVMGDWASMQAGMKAALEAGTVETMTFPATEDLFVFTSDTFPLPIGGPTPDEAKAFLRTMMDDEVQIAFSKEKGSIPARRDIPLERLSERAQATKLDFENSRKLLATSGLFPSYYPDEILEDLLIQIATRQKPEKAIDDVIRVLGESQAQLKYWNELRLAGTGP